MLYKNEFYNHLRVEGRGEGTVRQYRPMFGRLRKYMETHGIENINALTETDAHSISRIIETEGLSTERVYRLLLNVKRYFAFLEQSGFIYLSPAAMFRLPKFVRHHHRAYDEKAISELLGTVRADTPLRLRARAILELAYSSALRPREVRALKLSDIDFAGGKLFIDQSKGKKDRIVPVGKTAIAWLRRYLEEVRGRFLKNNIHDVVFISLVTGKPLSSRGLDLAVREALMQSHQDPIPLYSLRATAATNLLDRGMNVVHIGRFLGHAGIGMTQVYLHTRRRELAHIISEAHPRNRINNEEEDSRNDT